MIRQPEPERMDVPERAEAYARADFSAVNAAFLTRLLDLIANAPLRQALDLGTGPGELAWRLARTRRELHVMAIDASMPMLRLALDFSRTAPNLAFVLADAKQLPIPSRSCDLIFSNSLLHHLPDPAPFWQELRRVARPGALVLVRDLFRPESPTEARRLVDQYATGEHALLREDFYNSFLAAFTPREAQEQIASAGLNSLEVTSASDRHMDIAGQIE